MPDKGDMNPVAGALCMLAVAPWAKCYAEHVEMAAAAYDQCCNGFAQVEVEQAATEALIGFLKKVGKK